MFREGTPLRAASPVAPGPHPQGPFPAHQLRWPTASDAHGGAPPTDSPPGTHRPSRMQPCGKPRFHPLGCGLLTPVLGRAVPLCSFLGCAACRGPHGRGCPRLCPSVVSNALLHLSTEISCQSHCVFCLLIES